MAVRSKTATGKAKSQASEPKMQSGEPVAGFPITFEWNDGHWATIFDRQTELVIADVQRARLEGRLVVYLSVPISPRGGSFQATNVDIAMETERRLHARWGESVWVLNPARYQMESKGGYGLIEQHARAEKIDLAALMKRGGPTGGDYMRMWTRVLVTDGGPNLGERFDGFYFLGPSDIAAFLNPSGNTMSRAVEEYFASKFSNVAEFRYRYTEREPIDWGARDIATFTPADWKPLENWDAMRREFLRFYVLRASANYSRGSHDEWNIWALLNRRRLETYNGDPGVLIPGYFDGRQVDLGAAVTFTSGGYGTVHLATRSARRR